MVLVQMDVGDECCDSGFAVLTSAAAAVLPPRSAGLALDSVFFSWLYKLAQYALLFSALPGDVLGAAGLMEVVPLLLLAARDPPPSNIERV